MAIIFSIAVEQNLKLKNSEIFHTGKPCSLFSLNVLLFFHQLYQLTIAETQIFQPYFLIDIPFFKITFTLDVT
jgi:hypothetical protein